MKKILFAAAFVATACTGQVPENQCQMEINVEGLPETMAIYVQNAEMNDWECDTITAVDGKFTYTANLTGARQAYLISLDEQNYMTFYALPGEKLVLTGTPDEYHMGGSKAYEEMEAAGRVTDEMTKKVNELSEEFQKRVEAGEDREAVSHDIMPRYEAIMKEAEQAHIAYIEANPKSISTVPILSGITIDKFGRLDSLIDDKVKTGIMADLYNKAKERYDREQARIAAKALLKEGAEAPDFTLPALDGSQLSLSSLRGKYVVIDFWGSWCGWCIKGMPEMKKYYEKYAGKLEILGVDCRDSEEKWKEAVEKHQLPWLHVQNGQGENDITTRYAIEGYPTKLILNPEGKIVKYIVGEDPAFYTALDAVLGE